MKRTERNKVTFVARRRRLSFSVDADVVVVAIVAHVVIAVADVVIVRCSWISLGYVHFQVELSHEQDVGKQVQKRTNKLGTKHELSERGRGEGGGAWSCG